MKTINRLKVTLSWDFYINNSITLMISSREGLFKAMTWYNAHMGCPVFELLEKFYKDKSIPSLAEDSNQGFFIKLTLGSVTAARGLQSYPALRSCANMVDVDDLELIYNEDITDTFNKYYWLHNRAEAIGADKAFEEFNSSDKDYIHDFHGKTGDQILELLNQKSLTDIILTNIDRIILEVTYNVVNYSFAVDSLDITHTIEIPYKFDNCKLLPNNTVRLTGKTVDIDLPKLDPGSVGNIGLKFGSEKVKTGLIALALYDEESTFRFLGEATLPEYLIEGLVKEYGN